MNDVEDTRDRNDDRHVFNHDADREGENGLNAILQAFIRNPAGAVQIIAFVGGLFGIYYAIQGEISDVKAAQVTNSMKFGSDLEHLGNVMTEQSVKIEALYTRGDTRYTAIIGKLSSHDVDIAEIKTGVNFIVGQYSQHHSDIPTPFKDTTR